ncbi:MAG: helix-turn-helix domain-containing protein [Oscillospiraceae bacterium]|nr:helix-turn-helix domain-containing protein [Oscillospiraceae bacterium]
MKIYFGENLKKLRRARDLTQEDLARFLNVTFQAVSKWERGETTPDIAVLPSIARYFGVTTDELLGTDKIDENARRDEIYAKSRELSENGLVDESVAHWRDAYGEFPNDYAFIGMYMSAMYLRMTAHGDTRDCDEIYALGTRVLDECTDEQTRLGVIQTLCLTYALAGDEENAVRYAQMAPILNVTYQSLMEHVLKGDALRRTAQSNLAQELERLWQSVFSIMQSREMTHEEQIHYFETLLGIFELVYEDGRFGFYHTRMRLFHFCIAQRYARLQNLEKTLEHAEIALYHARAYDDIERPYIMHSPLMDGYEFAGVTSKNFADTETALTLRNLGDAMFEFCRGDERWRQLIIDS